MFICMLLGLLLLSFAVLSKQNHRLLPEVWQTLKSFCLKYHLQMMDLEYRSGVVFPSNLNLLLSEYIKFWLFALFTEFLNNLIITCFQQGKKTSCDLRYSSYLGKSVCQCWWQSTHWSSCVSHCSQLAQKVLTLNQGDVSCISKYF